MIDRPVLSLRLAAIYDAIPECDRVVDVGTDHGYIPITCVLTGKAGKGLALDVREGPLQRARVNAAKYNVSDKIGFSLTNGLDGIALSSDDCVVIAGMGGLESISIIKEAGRIPCKIVLQPQRSAFDLRKFLDINGYTIISEKIVSERGKYYPVILSEYTGVCTQLSMIEAYAGKNTIFAADKDPKLYTDELPDGYLEYLIEIARKRKKSDPIFEELFDKLLKLQNSQPGRR